MGSEVEREKEMNMEEGRKQQVREDDGEVMQVGYKFKMTHQGAASDQGQSLMSTIALLQFAVKTAVARLSSGGKGKQKTGNSENLCMLQLVSETHG